MSEPILNDVYLIEDAETLELLADATRLEIIETLSHPKSVKDLAEAMEVPRTRLYHHVKLLEESGMIRVVEERPAGAMIEKIYQVAARSFQPSPGFLDNSSPRQRAAALLDSLFGATRADFVRAVDSGKASLDLTGETSRIGLSRRVFRLRPEQLEQLVEDMEALIVSYGDEGDDPDAITVAAVYAIYPSSRSLS